MSTVSRIIAGKFFKVQILLFMLLVASAVFTYIAPGHAYAYSTLPQLGNELPQTSMASIGGVDRQPYLAVGDGGYVGHRSWAKIYVPTSVTGLFDITINKGAGVCGVPGDIPTSGSEKPNVLYSVWATNSSEGWTATPAGDPAVYQNSAYSNPSGSTPCGDVHLNIQLGSSPPATSIPGHGGFRVFYIQAELANPCAIDFSCAGSIEKSFRITVPGSSIVGFSRPVVASSGVANAYVGIYMRDAPSNWDFAFAYAPRCGEDSGGKSATIGIFDADYGVYSQPILYAAVSNSPRTGAPSWTVLKSLSGGQWKTGTLQHDDMTYTSYSTRRNLFEMKDVNPINTIQLSLPYDQFDALNSVGQACQADKPQGQLTLNCSASSYSVAGIKDPDDGTVARNYRVTHGSPNTVGEYTPGGNLVDVSSSVYGSKSGALTVVGNRVYYLQVQDDNGLWFNTDSASDPCNGSGPSGGKCTTWSESPPPTYTNTTGTYGTRNTVRVKNAANSTLSGGYGVITSNATTPMVLNYTANTPTLSITILHEYNGPSGWTSIPASLIFANPTVFNVTCYKATCSLTVRGDGPSDIILSGGTIHVSGVIYNSPDPAYPDKTDLPAYLNGSSFPLGITTDGGVAHNAGQGVPLGGSVDVSFDLPANTYSQGNQSINAYPDFYGYGSLGPNCTVDSTPAGGTGNPFPVYSSFNIVPSATIDPAASSENPTVINYTTTGTNSSGPPIPASAQSSLSKEPAGGGYTDVQTPPATNDSYGNVSHAYSYNNTSFQAGDKFCAHVTINPATGYYGTDGSFQGTGSATNQNPACFTVHNEPYVHIFGSDVSAGGGFGTNCSNDTAGIRGFVSNTGAQPVGSGVQIGALSIGPISGFGSAIIRPSAPLGSTGLTFSNTVNLTGGAANTPNMGGDLNNQHCIKDYFADKPDSLPTLVDTSTTASASTPLDGKPSNVGRYYEPTGGTLTIFASTISSLANASIFVKGNVVIAQDIKYDTGDPITGWGAPENIPSFRLYVKGGNIYVQPGVKQLDGMYVAQPDSTGNGGKIYSCANGTSRFQARDMIANCNNQLVVNGAFVSQKLFLDRSFGSLRNSSPGERIGSGAKTCDGGAVTNYSDCSAEIFNFSPELYYTQITATPPNEGPGTGKFDSITSLPPVL